MNECQTNSPCQHLRKCIENRMENMHTDVRVQRVRDKKYSLLTLHFYSSAFTFLLENVEIEDIL